jgi:MFS family permease
VVIGDVFPSAERGKDYGYDAIGYHVGAAVGVLFGGVIVTCCSWQWILRITVPIGEVALLVALRVLKDRGGRVLKPGSDCEGDACQPVGTLGAAARHRSRPGPW